MIWYSVKNSKISQKDLRNEDECDNELEIVFSCRDFLCFLFSSFYGNLMIFVFIHSASALKVLINVQGG